MTTPADLAWPFFDDGHRALVPQFERWVADELPALILPAELVADATLVADGQRTEQSVDGAVTGEDLDHTTMGEPIGDDAVDERTEQPGDRQAEEQLCTTSEHQETPVTS